VLREEDRPEDLRAPPDDFADAAFAVLRLAALFDAVLFDAVRLDAVLFDAVRLDAVLFDAVRLDAPLLLPAVLRFVDVFRELVRDPPVDALAAAVTDLAAFSRSLISVRLPLLASLCALRSAAATSLYAARAPLPKSVRIVASSLFACSSAFWKRAVASSTSLRVIGDFAATLLAAVLRRVAGFLAGGMFVTPPDRMLRNSGG
jgi:hypothetical protein